MLPWQRTFAIIWSGQFVSVLSSEAVSYALIFWVSLETGSAEVLATAAIAGMLPQSVLGFFVGAYIDRWDRKRTMILADTFIALCTLALALLFFAGRAELIHIYLLQACRSAGAAFHKPAMQAATPMLAPADQLTRIAGVNQMISSCSSLVCPAIGAALLASTHIGNILLLDVAGAAVACAALAVVRIPNPEPTRREPDLRREVREGFAAIGSVRGMPGLFAQAIAVWVLIMPVGVLFPLITLRHFGGGTFEMSFVEIVWGCGALAGGLAMGARSYRMDRILMIQASYILVGVAFLVPGLLPPGGFYWFAALTAVAGVASSLFSATFIAVVQSRFAPGILGRVLSLYYSMGLLPSTVALLGAGFLADGLGITTTFVASGALICLMAAAGLCIPSIREMERRSRTPER